MIEKISSSVGWIVGSVKTSGSIKQGLKVKRKFDARKNCEWARCQKANKNTEYIINLG